MRRNPQLTSFFWFRRNQNHDSFASVPQNRQLKRSVQYTHDQFAQAPTPGGLDPKMGGTVKA